MGRDYTPRELYYADKRMTRDGYASMFDIMQGMITEVYGISQRRYSDEDIARRQQYPIIGTVLDDFEKAYAMLSGRDGGQELLADYEKQLQNYLLLGERPQDPKLRLWFEGELDPHFFYSHQNDAFFWSILKNRRKNCHGSSPLWNPRLGQPKSADRLVSRSLIQGRSRSDELEKRSGASPGLRSYLGPRA